MPNRSPGHQLLLYWLLSSRLVPRLVLQPQVIHWKLSLLWLLWPWLQSSHSLWHFGSLQRSDTTNPYTVYYLSLTSYCALQVYPRSFYMFCMDNGQVVLQGDIRAERSILAKFSRRFKWVNWPQLDHRIIEAEFPILISGPEPAVGHKIKPLKVSILI